MGERREHWPKRVKLSRKRGWRKPPNTVVVSRPSRWGNPYKLSDYDIRNADDSLAPRHVVEREAREMAVRDFDALLSLGKLPYTREDVRRELRGKNLACWCPLDQPCHADVLLEVANEVDDG